MSTITNVLQIVVLLGALFLGVRLGGIGIGLAAGLGVILLGLLGLDTDYVQDIPFSVIAIIMAVIAAIAAMQIAGGMDYLVSWAGKILRKHPRQIIIWAPIITFFMTVLAGTGNTAFSTLPVIAEVSKENNIRPARPLAISVVASQIAICASPVSAAVVWMTSQSSYPKMGTKPIGYLDLLLIMIPGCLLAVIVLAIIMNILPDKPLSEDPEFQRRLTEGSVSMRGTKENKIRKGAKTSVLIFIATIILVMIYATLISPKVNVLHTGLGRSISHGKAIFNATDGIIALMLTAGAVIMIVCKVKAADILEAPTFKAGMNSVICVLGVAWLGTVYINGHLNFIKSQAGSLLKSNAWLFIIIVFTSAALLYSQAATAKTMMPIAFALNMSQASIIAAFPAVSALFLLPTYPTLVAAVQMDDTGSTKIGKYVFNHPFFIPGIVVIVLAAAFCFGLASLIL